MNRTQGTAWLSKVRDVSCYVRLTKVIPQRSTDTTLLSNPLFDC